MKIWKAIGLMSGSSLDGLDIAYAEFWEEKNRWHFDLKTGETVNYSTKWLHTLKNIQNLSASEIILSHHQYGKFIGEATKQFISQHHLNPDIIASHGHTIFHNPAQGYTFQLGYGQEIATETNIVTVSDFRSKDIALGGQGAPLVPIGDKLLFGDYKACVNLGGISNISYEKDNSKRIGFDVCPANQLLNHLSKKKGLEFDNKGAIAARGKKIDKLFRQLTENNYYSMPIPKSLSNEYVTNTFIPILESSKETIEDKLHTTTLHIAHQLQKAILSIDELHHVPTSQHITPKNSDRIIITGGGAFNSFLISELKKISTNNIFIPGKMLINFKEALIFAFMGILRINNKINCLSSVTGASQDSSTGIIFQK